MGVVSAAWCQDKISPNAMIDSRAKFDALSCIVQENHYNVYAHRLQSPIELLVLLHKGRENTNLPGPDYTLVD